MKIRQPKLVLNPYEWLPGYGESSVSFRSSGTDVVIDVQYEKELVEAAGSESFAIVRREILFKSVRTFIREPFPGGGIFGFDGDPNAFNLGELTEFLGSDLRDALEAGRGLSQSTPSKLRHFSIQFLSENSGFHVLAEGVSLSDELPIP